MTPKLLSIMPKKRFEDAGVDFPPELDVVFDDARQEDEIIAACRGMDYLFVPAPFPPITARVLENIPSVRMIQTSGTGYDKVDVATAARLKIPVANAPGQNITTVAELTVAMLIALLRKVTVADREIKAGNYAPVRERIFQFGLKEVCDIRLGLLGLGAIGCKVAQIVQLLGGRVSYFDVFRPNPQVEDELQVTYLDFDELLRTSDAVSLHLPLNEETRSIINSDALQQMPVGSFLINTARGEVVDQEALAAALESSHLAGAAIDTVYPEPPPDDHPLLNLSAAARDRLLITPHIAGTTKGAFQRMLSTGVDNVAAAAAGKPLKNVVNGIKKLRIADS
jgi:phosphoglycerate dehydrogenase-like enzyme